MEENVEVNDRVVIVSECSTKGLTGSVITIFYGKCFRYAMVHLDNGIKRVYNLLSVNKIHKEKRK